MLTVAQHELIIDKLQNTDESYKDIAKQAGCNVTTVRYIDSGDSKMTRELYNKSFPIRNPIVKRAKAAKYHIDKILTKYDITWEQLIEEVNAINEEI